MSKFPCNILYLTDSTALYIKSRRYVEAELPINDTLV